MMMDESVATRDDVRAHAQISWYNTSSSTTILPCNEVKPFLESYEVDSCFLKRSMKCIINFIKGTNQQKDDRRL